MAAQQLAERSNVLDPPIEVEIHRGNRLAGLPKPGVQREAPRAGPTAASSI